MFDKYLRPFFQTLFVDPIAKFLTRSTFITPLFLTSLGCFVGLSAALAIWYQTPWLAFFALLLSGYLDLLDGTLARLQDKSTPIGSVLDFFSDRVVDFAILLALFGIAPHERGFLSLLMLGSIFLCVTSFLLVAIFVENHSEKGMHFSPGLIERGETFLFFFLMLCFPSGFALLAWLFSGLVFFTAGIRLFQFCCNFSTSHIRSEN